MEFKFRLCFSPHILTLILGARLWKELQQVRAERRKAEKQRQDLVQQAKVITSKMNQKRSSGSLLFFRFLEFKPWIRKTFIVSSRSNTVVDTC